MRPAVAGSASPRIWAALGACMVIPAIGNGVFISCFPLWVVPWITEFNVSRSTALAGFTVGNLVMGLASPLVGNCLERFPARWNVALGGAALAAGFLLGAAAHSFWQIIILYATILALGAAFTGMLPAQSVAVRIVPHKAGTISGVITMSISMGGIVMPSVLTGPVAFLGWRYTFAITGAIVLAGIVPAAWFLLRGFDERSVAAHGSGSVTTDVPRTTTVAVFGRLAFWVPLMGVVPAMFVVGTVLTNAVAIAADNGIAIGVAGYLVPAIAAGGMVGSIGLGWLCDRLNYRLVFGTTAAATVVALLLLLGHVGPLRMALAFGMVGIVAGGVFPVVGVMVVRGFGVAIFARIMGMMMPPLIIAMAVAPVVAGWARDKTGSYDVAFVYCAILMFLSGTAVVALKLDTPESRAKLAARRAATITAGE
jgi:MFS family permease